ncbi:MAG: fructosamine kinase family protein [Opitutae bacterium]|nr:fructosamine kinase family protein [Opitutae bacterium]MBT4223637.1 fructosamine kinase family protein [Opitutae bacterium]MBT5379328.1 fructosamine kinase family protein [Opitutae bacterium]MBT5690346.1 fructosamine kinase family protein [Opitutae bacterium]MBT6463719.1 fructosamine kinase family protein [Opitutae bacterium]
MDAICKAISEATGEKIEFISASPLAGGCINDANRLESSSGPFFVKLNQPSFLEAFHIESLALMEMGATRTIRVPKPVCNGIADGRAFLVLEFIEMGPPQAGSQAKAGQQLANMHRNTGKAFGWHCNNTIGATPQQNPLTQTWTDFYRSNRLGFQLELAARGGQAFHGADKLLERLEDYFENYNPVPSLLHGDLWSGNIGYGRHGQPAIFDPATYYGDRETDLAFTEMFGGFGPEFYNAYDETWPRDSGFKIRKKLYNLYHYLNHHNLFGGGYSSTAQVIIYDLLKH